MNDKHREDDEIEIDLGRLFGILWDRKKVQEALSLPAPSLP